MRVRADVVPIEDGSWTLVLLPDTQHYAEKYPHIYDAQTQWIADHAKSHNIKYVLHEGDITNNNIIEQWDNALRSMNRLNGTVPYAIAPGNHDYGPKGNAHGSQQLLQRAEILRAGFVLRQAAERGRLLRRPARLTALVPHVRRWRQEVARAGAGMGTAR